MTDRVAVDHANACFSPDTWIFGYFIGNKIRGAAELHLLPATSGLRPREAEAAFSVEKRWRHDGVGTALVERLILAARATAACARWSFPAYRRMSPCRISPWKFGATLKCETDEVTGKIRIELPTPQTLLSEFVEDLLDFASALFDFQKRILPTPSSGNRAA